MKRFLCMMAVLGLILTGCAAKGQGQVRDREQAEISAGESPSPIPVPPISELEAGESLYMLNLASRGRALVSEGCLYSYDFDEEWMGVLAAYDIGEAGLENRRILAADCEPLWLCADEESLYYLNANKGMVLETVRKDGSGGRQLTEHACSWLQLRGGVLWFCDDEGRFCRFAEGERTELAGPGLTYACILENCLLFTENDGILRCSDGEKEYSLSRNAAAAPVIWGDSLYYSSGEKLYRGFAGGGSEEELSLPPLYAPAEILPGEKPVIRGVSLTGAGFKQWTAAAGREAEELEQRGYRLLEYAGEEYRVECLYNGDSRIREFVLVCPDGTELSYIGPEESEDG